MYGVCVVCSRMSYVEMQPECAVHRPGFAWTRLIKQLPKYSGFHIRALICSRIHSAGLACDENLTGEMVAISKVHTPVDYQGALLAGPIGL